MSKNSFKEIVESLNYVNSMGRLVRVVNVALDKNLIESTATNILEKLSQLPIDGSLDDLISILSWAVSLAPTDSNTSLELLIQLCNRCVNEFESIPFEPKAFTLMVIFCCTDKKKEFLTKISSEQRISIGVLVAQIHLTTYSDVINEETRTLIDRIFCYMRDGLDYDQISAEFIKDGSCDGLGNTETGTVYEETVIPLILTLTRVMRGGDTKNFIDLVNRSLYTESLRDEWTRLGEDLSKFSNGALDLNDSKWLYISIYGDFYVFAEKVREYQTVPYPSAEVGELIWRLSSDIYEYHRLMADGATAEVFAEALRNTYSAFISYYHIFGAAKVFLYDLISSYCKTRSDTEWYKGDALRSVKLYLDRDPSFRMFCDEIDNSALGKGTEFTFGTDKNEAAYRMLIYRYLDPTYAASVATEAVGKRQSLREKEEELEQRERELKAREKRLKKKTSNDDEDEEEEPSDEDDEDQDGKPDQEIDARQSNKGYHKSSKIVSDGTRKVYGAYHKFKMNESRVDSQLDKMLTAAKTSFKGGDKTEAILSGKRWTPLGLLKQVLKTAAVFSFSKIAGFAYLVTTVALDKKRTEKQKREILGELDTEIRLIDEKIDDARGDGNRQAKYALMRTKGELERARDKIRYNLNASTGDLKTAKDLIIGKRYGGKG